MSSYVKNENEAPWLVLFIIMFDDGEVIES